MPNFLCKENYFPAIPCKNKTNLAPAEMLPVKACFFGNCRCHALFLHQTAVSVEILHAKTFASKFSRLYFFSLILYLIFRRNANHLTLFFCFSQFGLNIRHHRLFLRQKIGSRLCQPEEKRMSSDFIGAKFVFPHKKTERTIARYALPFLSVVPCTEKNQSVTVTFTARSLALFFGSGSVSNVTD